MPTEKSSQDDFTKASKTVRKQIAETEKKVGDATRQVEEEFLKTIEEMNRAVMSRATAELELGLKLSQKLTAARSLPDAMAACQEWLSEEMNARSDDARRFMTNSQKFMTTSTRLFSSSWSGADMSR